MPDRQFISRPRPVRFLVFVARCSLLGVRLKGEQAAPPARPVRFAPRLGFRGRGPPRLRWPPFLDRPGKTWTGQPRRGPWWPHAGRRQPDSGKQTTEQAGEVGEPRKWNCRDEAGGGGWAGRREVLGRGGRMVRVGREPGARAVLVSRCGVGVGAACVVAFVSWLSPEAPVRLGDLDRRCRSARSGHSEQRRREAPRRRPLTRTAPTYNRAIEAVAFRGERQRGRCAPTGSRAEARLQLRL